MTINDISFEWIKYKEAFVKISSISAYMLLLENHILPSFGHYETEIPESTVQEWVLEKIKSGMSKKTVGDILIVLNMILKYGKKRGVFNYTPFDIVYPTESVNKTLEVLTIKQTNELISYLKENFSFRNLGILIAISTGVRIGEVCAMKWNDIDLDRGVLTVNKTLQRVYICKPGEKRETKIIINDAKTSASNREIPLSPDILKIVKKLQKIVNPEWYILTNDKKATEPRVYRNYYYAVMRELQIPIIKFHGLRHSFATRCINANVDIKTVSVLLGHSNVTTTLNVYTHPDLEQKKSAINKMFKSLK